VKSRVVELPIQRRQRYEKSLGLTPKESMVLVEERGNAELFEEAIAAGGNPRRVVNMILGTSSKVANEKGVLVAELPAQATEYAKLARMLEEGMLSSSSASAVLDEINLTNPAVRDPEQIAKDRGWIQVRDVGATEKWVEEALAANPNAIDSYKNNPKKKQASLGFLRGAVMKLSQGKADPKLVGELLEKRLNG